MKMYSFSRLQYTCITNQTCRHLFTSNVNNGNISKQSRFLKKLLRNEKSHGADMIDFCAAGTPKKELSIHTKRRMNALNKIFMAHITDLMTTGEAELALTKRNIEISHVQVTADFKFVNVYWIDNSTGPSDTGEILKECAFRLRHALSQLRVIGIVPPIQFVKCKNVETLKEVERRLQIADYGEDYVPSLYPFAHSHTVTSKKSVDEAENAEKPVQSNIEDDVFSVTLPVMKHDVFGLDHARIMSKIKAASEKSQKALIRRSLNVQSHTIPDFDSVKQNIPSFLTKQEEKEQFSKFLANRRKEQRNKYRKNFAREDIVMLNDNEEECEEEYEQEYEQEYEHDDKY